MLNVRLVQLKQMLCRYCLPLILGTQNNSFYVYFLTIKVSSLIYSLRVKTLK